MHDVDAFLSGMKPAHYGNKGCSTTMKHIDKLRNYPYVTDGINISEDDYFLFFQNEELKQDFVKQLAHVESRSPQFHQLLGNALGYPPLATQFYATCQENKQNYDYSIGLMYGGVRCVSHVDDLIDNATWLWDRYTDDKDLRIQIKGNLHPVKRYDLDKLHEFQVLHKQKEAAAV